MDIFFGEIFFQTKFFFQFFSIFFDFFKIFKNLQIFNFFENFQIFIFFENFQIQKKFHAKNFVWEKKSAKRKFAVEQAKQATYTSSI